MIDDYIEEGCVYIVLQTQKKRNRKLVDCYSKTTCFYIVNNVFRHKKPRVFVSRITSFIYV